MSTSQFQKTLSAIAAGRTVRWISLPRGKFAENRTKHLGYVEKAHDSVFSCLDHERFARVALKRILPSLLPSVADNQERYALVTVQEALCSEVVPAEFIWFKLPDMDEFRPIVVAAADVSSAESLISYRFSSYLPTSALIVLTPPPQAPCFVGNIPKDLA